MTAYPYLSQNPQATEDYDAGGANNSLPPFITPAGPVREMRLQFFRNPNGSLNTNAPDGGVHDLYSVTGRSDATGCTIGQPNFGAEVQSGNAVFRIPTPVFGAGLIENIDDATILANQAANSAAKTKLGISGFPNRSGNDGTITRFGWKAQNKSLLMFAGEAYNVEDGVTNELFPTQRAEPGHSLPPGCKTNHTPEDTSNLGTHGPCREQRHHGLRVVHAHAGPAETSAADGVHTFRCSSVRDDGSAALCHPLDDHRDFPFQPLALECAGESVFRPAGAQHGRDRSSGRRNARKRKRAGISDAAPLWGVGQRVFFLHDGRTSDLMQAIQAHSGSGSEAKGSIQLFNGLSASQQQNLLNFLRSL